LALLVAAGCGQGSSGGGDGGGDSTDLEAVAAQVSGLLDQIEALPTTATSAQEFSTQLAPLREQVQTLQEQVEQTQAPENLSSQRDQLANRLRSLRTQLGRIDGLLANGDLETATTATEQLISLQQLRATITAIENASGG
jgi:soluble cytochrome b562